jgi:hypothetical protein
VSTTVTSKEEVATEWDASTFHTSRSVLMFSYEQEEAQMVSAALAKGKPNSEGRNGAVRGKGTRREVEWFQSEEGWKRFPRLTGCGGWQDRKRLLVEVGASIVVTLVRRTLLTTENQYQQL